MLRRVLPFLALGLGLPAFAAYTWRAEIAEALVAVAEPPALMEGCTDVPEAVALAEELKLRAQRIDRSLAEIEKRKAELADAQATLQAKLVELKAVRSGISSRRTAASTAVQQDIDRLVAVYDQMKPAEAAKVLTNLPPDFAAEILMRVQPEAGARIIAAVDPGQAAILTTHMGARSAKRN